jgi:predicted nucleotidyltransferase
MSDVAEITLETIIAKLREIAPAIKAEGVTRLAVFGSRARGDARPDSDLDILLEHAPRASGRLFFDLFKVMHLIEDTVGLTTHISTPDELTPRIGERMADDLVEVF